MKTETPDQKHKLLDICMLLLLGTLIYSNTFYSSFHFDDITSIVDNCSIRNIFDLKTIFTFWPTRLITYISVAFNYHVGQLNVFGYHLFNLAAHLISALLVWWLALLTFSTPAMRDLKIAERSRLIALFTGLIFISHPIQTQGVTYIIQRAASLATLFYLASISLYVKSRLLQEQGRNPAVSMLLYCGSLLAVTMAMLTKEMTITLPLMILFYETFFLKTKGRLKLKHLLPFFATLLIIPLTMLMTKNLDVLGMRRGGEFANPASLYQYLLTQFRVIVTYIRLLFIPVNQNLDYDYHISKNLLELPVLASLIVLVLILIAAIRIRSKHKLISFGIFWFFITLSPESGIFPIKDVIFEHRLYLPTVGFSFFLVSAIYHIFENKTLKSMVAVLLIVTSCYAVLAYKRNLVWKNEITLWNDTVRKSPGKARPYNNHGNAYGRESNLAQAISDFTRAIEIDPDYAEAYNNRGSAYGRQNNLPKAISDFNNAIRIKPKYAEAYNNRGMVYGQAGILPQAILDFNMAITINPSLAKAYNNRGNAYGQQGNLLQAISDFTRAIEIDPNFAEAYNNRGFSYYTAKEYDRSWTDVHKAERLGVKNLKFLQKLKEASNRVR